MFNSKLTDYDVVDATPYHADPLKALADACRQQGIKLFFYYSLLDWHHPDFFPLGKTGRATGREGRGDWERYVAYYQGQVRELCTNYGEIGGLWFDGWWDRPDAAWDLERTYRMIHELQPGALVGNNHHVDPMPGEDFQMFEQDLPGENAAGFNKAGVAADRPMETCLTINHSWGFNAADDHYKSTDELIRALVGAAGRGANLLVNVGPLPDGPIAPEQSQRLLEVGKWLAANGESIYGTRAGPIAPQPWGVSTAKGSRERPSEIYLHILKPDAGSPIILKEAAASLTPYLFGKDAPLKLTQAAGGMALDLPRDARAPVEHDRGLAAAGDRPLNVMPTRGVRAVDVKSEPYPKRRVDPMGGLMLLVTLAALAGAAWLHFGRSSAPEASTVAVGAEAPPLRLLDLETSEPVVLAGLHDKVVWVVFWSAGAVSGPSCLAELETASRRLRMHRRFAMVTAAVEIDNPAAVRGAVQKADFKLPTYLVGSETRRRFHAENADPPLHVLIDAGGRVIAMARDNGQSAVGRIAEEARRRLDELDPLGETRFASAVAPGMCHSILRAPGITRN